MLTSIEKKGFSSPNQRLASGKVSHFIVYLLHISLFGVKESNLYTRYIKDMHKIIYKQNF